MLYIYSSNIRTGQFSDFDTWIAENKERFAKAQPEKWKLKEVYLTAFGLGTAHVEIHWEIEGYGALDVARATAEKKGDFFKLLTKVHSFLDPATGSARLLRTAGLPEAQKAAGSRGALIVGC